MYENKGWLRRFIDFQRSSKFQIPSGRNRTEPKGSAGAESDGGPISETEPERTRAPLRSVIPWT